MQLTTLCTSAWNSGSVDANFLLELRLSLVDIEILHLLASWKGSEMERIWSDEIGPRLEYE